MASSPPPPPPSTPHQSNSPNKLDYYYFVIGLALIAIVLLITNAVAVGCCTWLRAHFLSSRGAASDPVSRGALRQLDEVRLWIPAFKYRKKDRQAHAEGIDEECAVCLSAFNEADEVRQLPYCSHSFHAACIDVWFQSHVSCPVCRGSVVPTPVNSMDMSAQFHSQAQFLPGEGTSNIV